MNSVEIRFLEPLDVLSFRSNKLFGEPGSFGDSLMPPPPSQVAGALRSQILVETGTALKAFARGQVRHPQLGTPAEPGPFTVALVTPARRFTDGRFELVMRPPHDLVVFEESDRKGPCQERRKPVPQLLVPRDLQVNREGWCSSYDLPLLPVLAQKKQSKPRTGYWLTESGWRKYLTGGAEGFSDQDLGCTRHLWKLDTRPGVGLSRATRAAEEGRLFTNRVIACVRREHLGDGREGYHTGLLVACAGLPPDSLRDGCVIRLGGDGRAAAVRSIPGYSLPSPDYEKICRDGRCRLVLASPGIFEKGWLPTGCRRENGEVRFELHGVEARLAAAVVPRAEVVSGWDLAQWEPKPGVRAAPAGSVYWLDELQATSADLERLVGFGLWEQPEAPDPRRAEGFNRIWLAEWPKEDS